MTITRVQSLSAGSLGGVTSTNLIFPSPVTAGNLLICYIVDSQGSSADVFVVSDNVNAGNYHNDVQPVLTNTNTLAITSLKNTLGGTITVTGTTSGSFAGIYEFGIEEWSGLDTGSPLDQTGVGSNSFSGTALATTSGSIVLPNELVLGAVALFSSNTPITSNFGTLGFNPDTHFASSYQILTSGSGAQSAGFSFPGSGWCCGVATYKAASVVTDASNVSGPQVSRLPKVNTPPWGVSGPGVTRDTSVSRDTR